MQLRTHTYKRCGLTAHSKSKGTPHTGVAVLIDPAQVQIAIAVEAHAAGIVATALRTRPKVSARTEWRCTADFLQIPIHVIHGYSAGTVYIFRIFLATLITGQIYAAQVGQNIPPLTILGINQPVELKGAAYFSVLLSAVP